MIWDGDYYYLTGYCDERNEIRTFRVDRIEKQPDVLDQPMVPKPKDYRVERYTQEVFRMFATQETAEVKLLCENDLMKSVIDVFGSNVRTKAVDKEHFLATVKVCLSPTFFRWVFGWDGKLRIYAPDEVKIAYREMLQTELTNY